MIIESVKRCYYIWIMNIQTNPKRIVKFSVSIRQETQLLIDQIANDENRSRSSMIDIICNDFCKKKRKSKLTRDN